MPNLGLGLSPLGVGPYGFGTPATAPLLGGGIYLGPKGEQFNSRAISLDRGTAGQYVYNEFGRARGMPDVQQLVILAAKTELGSSAAQTLGNEFNQVRYVGDSFEQEQRARVEAAFASLVGQGLIRIDSIEVDGGNGLPSKTLVHITDLTTGNPIEPVTL